jgi:capsular exopolysaccharide synthesis family protein
MSRVYEALRQSELDNGVTPTMLDPDTFLSVPVTEHPVAEQGTTATLDWSQIVELVPRIRPESRVVTLTDDDGLGAEKFRLLRARIRHLRESQQIRRLVITSSVPDEGKTLVAMNLAVSLSKHTTQRVLLLEGDLRKPTLGEHLGIKALPGVGDWATSANEPITKFICRFDNLQLWILPAGSAHEDPVNILQSERFLELYRYLSSCFDWILIDAPPLLPMADMNFWSRQADGVLLVVREGRTPKSVLSKGLEALDNPNVVGVVLNDAHEVDNTYYNHYYHHYGKKKDTV